MKIEDEMAGFVANEATKAQELTEEDIPKEPTTEEKLSDALAYLQTHVWPKIPPDILGKRVPKEEYDALFE